MRSILLIRSILPVKNPNDWSRFSSRTLLPLKHLSNQQSLNQCRSLSLYSLSHHHHSLDKNDEFKRNLLFITPLRFNSTATQTPTETASATETAATTSETNVIDLTENKSILLENEIVSNSLTDVTSVAALNLGSNWSPVGWCVHYLDFLHAAFPWWGAIAVGTVLLRICMFPFVISAQRSAAKLNELLPAQALLKEKINQARISGDTVEFARLSQESMTMYKRHGVNPFKAMLAPLAQAPVFVTFFITLRRMAYHPVESLKDGGLFWFEDLTISDPFYLLPLITCGTLWLTLETSFRSGMNPNQTPLIKYGARIIPIITLAFTFNFPTAILVYWCTNNFISLIQVNLLQIKSVRNFLNIPQIKVKPKELDINKKSFRQHFRETMDNAKINRILEERNSIDEIAFKKAGVGPLQKTYKHDPTARN